MRWPWSRIRPPPRRLLPDPAPWRRRRTGEGDAEGAYLERGGAEARGAGKGGGGSFVEGKERKATGEEEEGGDGPGLDQNGLSRGRRGKRQVMEKEMCARCVREFPCTFDQSSLARTE